MNIVVVEDHQDLRELFVAHLLQDGFNVLGANCAEELDDHLAKTAVDLLILDINLPGENGFDVARRVRAMQSGMNIIMLTARNSEMDRILGYESGADLYLPKPVSPKELSAAVRSVCRRVDSSLQTQTQITLNVSRMMLTMGEMMVGVSKSDTALLKALAAAPERRLAYWRLFEVTDRDQSDLAKGQLELQVFRLRKKLAEIGVSEDFIKSVRREGYMLTLPLRVENS
jgi:DNA-binding response OmpR family regulator